MGVEKEGSHHDNKKTYSAHCDGARRRLYCESPRRFHSGANACTCARTDGKSFITSPERYAGACERTLAQLHAERNPDAEVLVGSPVNEISEDIDEFFLLVLDDYEKLDDSTLINAAIWSSNGYVNIVGKSQLPAGLGGNVGTWKTIKGQGRGRNSKGYVEGVRVIDVKGNTFLRAGE